MKKTASITDKTAFVVGNGPSLSSFNFQNLEDHRWVGMNAAYRHWERIHIYPSYYACLDEVVGISHAEEICKLVENSEINGIEAFLLRKNLIIDQPTLRTHRKVHCYEDLFSSTPARIRDLVTTGSHSALWLTRLGYDQIVLLGIDANYVEEIDIAKAQKGNIFKVVKSGENPNYYFNDYQKTGDSFMTPNPVPGVHTGAWTRVAQYLSQTAPKVTLLNGSSISEVDCIPFIDIPSFFKSESEVINPQNKFSDPQHKRHRQAKIIVPEISHFSIISFLDQIAPAKYHQFSGREKYLRNFPALGWTKVEESKLRRQWSVQAYPQITSSNYESSVPLESAIVVAHSDHAKNIWEATRQLLRNYDTVLIISILQNAIYITPASIGLDLIPSFVIAFKRERFSQRDIQAALEASVSKSYRGKHKWRRRAYHYLMSLKEIAKHIRLI